MRCLALLALVCVALAATPGTYSSLTLTSNNPDECSACTLEAGATEEAVSACLADVPITCTYNSTLTVASATLTPCDSNLGISLSGVWTALPSATVSGVTGAVALTLPTTPTPPGICDYEVFTSDNETDECVEPTGTGTTNGLKLTDGSGPLDLSQFPKRFINMKTTVAGCGPKFASATIDTLRIDVNLTGTQSTEDTSGAAPFLGLSFTAALLGSMIIA